MEKIGFGALGEIFLQDDKIYKVIKNLNMYDTLLEIKKKEEAINNIYPIPKTYEINKGKKEIVVVKEYVKGITLEEAFRKGTFDLSFLLTEMIKLQFDINSHPFNFNYKYSDKIKKSLEKVTISNKEEIYNFLSTLKENMLCHGDFHPQNIIVNDNTLRAIDWDNASAGDPLMDVARSFLLLYINEKEVAKIYLKAYLDNKKIDVIQIYPYLKCIAVEFLTEKSNSSNKKILNDILNNEFVIE